MRIVAAGNDLGGRLALKYRILRYRMAPEFVIRGEFSSPIVCQRHTNGKTAAALVFYRGEAIGLVVPAAVLDESAGVASQTLEEVSLRCRKVFV